MRTLLIEQYHTARGGSVHMRSASLCMLVALACARAPAPPAVESPPPPLPVAGSDDAGTPAEPAPVTPPQAAPDAGTTPGWTVAYREDFETASLPAPAWSPDPVPDDGPFADDGAFFKAQGVVPPKAYRITAPFGASGWLTAESYSRDSARPFSSLLSIVPDPSGAPGHVLKLASPVFTDATVVRPSQPLPAKYRISLRVGFADFGDGKPGLNGYTTGTETAEPWHPSDLASGQNGFYWLTILDAMPRPHNNTWIHHHRKVVIDSDNNTPPWMEMWTGSSFVMNGEHPIMMFALDGSQPVSDLYGPPFFSYSAGAWQPSGDVRAADSYLPGEWYSATIERSDGKFTLQISGRFKYGGVQTYRASIDTTAVFDADGFPDWFMFGDPHVNYYQGSVYYDDVTLETWTG